MSDKPTALITPEDRAEATKRLQAYLWQGEDGWVEPGVGFALITSFAPKSILIESKSGETHWSPAASASLLKDYEINRPCRVRTGDNYKGTAL